MARALLLAYGLVAYAVGVVAFACLVGFVGNFGVRGIDEGPQLGVVAALVRDLGLCALFGLQHSLMARERFKRRVTTLAPSAAERSTFVLAASACTFALILGWAPLPQVLWRADGLLAAALTGLSALGWLLNMGSTFAIDHFGLLGLRQALRHYAGKPPAPPARFVARGPYRIVRHPLMLGFLIAFWATPTMTVGHLLFALAMTGYILIGVAHEERDLEAALGADYAAYRRATPRLIPGLRPRAR